MNKNIIRLALLLPLFLIWVIGHNTGDYFLAYSGCSMFWFFLGGIFIKNIETLKKWTSEKGVNIGG